MTADHIFMAFETEPLRLKPFTWVETETMRGVSVPGSSQVFALPTLQSRGLRERRRTKRNDENELELCLRAAATRFAGHSDLTLQQIILDFRTHGPAVRLRSIRKMIEFLFDHGLIESESASGWIELLTKGTPPRASVFQRIRDSFLGQGRAALPSSPSQPSRLTLLPSAKNQTQPDPSWAQLPVIRQLPPGLREKVLTGARVRKFKRGDFLCREGANDRELMILLSGQAAVVRKAGKKKDTLRNEEPAKVVAVLETHAVFGEISYFLHEPRTADVVALSDGEVLCLPPRNHNREQAELDLKQFKGIQTRIWFLQALRRNPLFQELPTEAFDALLMHGEVVNFEPGKALVREGDAADSCFFIIQGRVRVVQRGKEINRLTSGSVIGEIALLFGTGGRTASAIADTPVITVKYTWTEFWKVLSSHLVLGLALEGLAEKRLARDLARLGDVS